MICSMAAPCFCFCFCSECSGLLYSFGITQVHRRGWVSPLQTLLLFSQISLCVPTDATENVFAFPITKTQMISMTPISLPQMIVLIKVFDRRFGTFPSQRQGEIVSTAWVLTNHDGVFTNLKRLGEGHTFFRRKRW